LRAVVGALQFRDWSKDCNRGWRSVVIATSCEYVATSATELASWEPEGWKHFSRSGLRRRSIQVHNQDLWQLLLVEIRKFQKGVNVSLWKVPGELNTRARRFFRQAAELPEEPVFKIFEEDGPLDLQSGPFLSGQDFCVAD
jgi:ribonuclease HI